MSDLPVTLKIVKLPDGRWATENGTGVGDLTRTDLENIHTVLMIWLDAIWRTKRPGDPDQ